MDYLCFSVTFLDQRFHGRGEGSGPEWPPSPLRLMQALVAASAGRWNERRILQHAAPALRWLETLPAPRIIAAVATPASQPYRLFVPDNVADKVAGSWSKGGDASIADYLTEKDVRPMTIIGEQVHYLYEVGKAPTEGEAFIDTLRHAARSITHLGWGIDMVVADASLLTPAQVTQMQGVRWHPSPQGRTQLRIPKAGTLDDLTRKHADFLGRIGDDGFIPVPPLRVFGNVQYRSQDDLAQRPYRVFELRNTDGSYFSYSHRRLIHIAGMVRHLSIRAMASKVLLQELYPDHDQSKDPFRDGSPPPGIENPDTWVDSYVAGHASRDAQEHRQFSYLPLPSVGHEHTDPGVRRVMIAAPVGDDAWLDHLARRLAGGTLKPVGGNDSSDVEPPILVPVKNDNVARLYTRPSSVWHSFTPVILPGHDDHKPGKTRKLIEKALAQSGVEQPCEFEWSAFSRFRKSFSAHKYDKDKRPAGYLRPDHLQSQTTVHLTIRFNNEVKVPGPIVIGSGRHCGFGIMAMPLNEK